MLRLGFGLAVLVAGCSLFPETPPTVDGALTGGTASGGTGGTAGTGGVAGSAGCGSETLTISAEADTYLHDVPPNDTHGGEALLSIHAFSSNSGYRGVIRFSTKTIPAKAKISSATVKLVLVKNAGGTHQLGFHRSLKAWVEAEASWKQAATGSDWTTGGGDVEALAGASQDVTPAIGVGSTIEWDVSDEITAFLGGDTNNGWIIKEDLAPYTGEELQFASREASASATRPKLEVIYSLCP